MPSDQGWAHDARWKFVVGHELGHMIEDFYPVAPAFQRFARLFVKGTDQVAAEEVVKTDGFVNDPDSALSPEFAADCTCNLVDESQGSHCLNSIERSAAAVEEAFSHFVSTRLWNRLPSEGGDGCRFGYYKPVGGTALLGYSSFAPVSVDCARGYKHRDEDCSKVRVTSLDTQGNEIAIQSSSEIDWLTFFWNITTVPIVDSQGIPHQVSMPQLLDAYNSLNGGGEPDQKGPLVGENFRFVLLSGLGLLDDPVAFDDVSARILDHGVEALAL
jgi:hypothetical protein